VPPPPGSATSTPTSCATRSPTAWKKAGATSEDLGQLGGWSSPEVLKRYGASLAVERSLEVYDRLDPMAGL
jgi:hypothetical protein